MTGSTGRGGGQVGHRPRWGGCSFISLRARLQATLQSVQTVIQIADQLNRSRQATQMGPIETDLPAANTPLSQAAEATRQFVQATEKLDSHFQNQKLDLTVHFVM